AVQWQKGAASISTVTQSSATSVTVPPYSITVLRLGAGSGGGGTTGPLRDSAANRCLDVNGANQTNGTPVIIWDCHGATNQQWTPNSTGTITGQEPHLCPPPPNTATANATAVALATGASGSSQQWTRQ